MNGRDLPNFFILGATKSGTTSLHHYLSQHPQVFLPKEKELQFFTDDKLYRLGVNRYVQDYFASAQAYPARGEATPIYFHRPEVVIPRIKEFMGNRRMKFIILLRDPVHRAWSHYLHMVRLGLETLPFDLALEAEEARCKKQPNGWYSYFRDGLYAKQLDQWFAAFPRESFLILFHHDFAKEPREVLRKIFQFLRIDEEIVIRDLSRINEAGEAKSRLLMKILMGRFPGAGYLKQVLPIRMRRRWGSSLRNLNVRSLKNHLVLSDEQETMLRNLYISDINQLEVMLDVPLSFWVDR